MTTFELRKALTAMVLTAGVVGIALMGFAFGNSLKPDASTTFLQHPLLHTGIACVTSAIVCWVLILGNVRRR